MTSRSGLLCAEATHLVPDIVNLTDTKKAFARGFWKGMAAPLMMFSTCDLAARQVEQTFMPLPRRYGGLTSDWVKVGDALRTAAESE